MHRTNKFWALLVCLGLLLLTTPVFAQGRAVDKRDLKGISPKYHRYLFSTVGGAAIGAGIGALVGGGKEMTKFMLIGGGTGSGLYLHSHRYAGGGLRDWAYMGTYTALGTGIGWTLCNCNDGAVAGALIGGGAAAVYRTMLPDRRQTASTQPTP